MSTTTTNFDLHKIELTDAPPDITVLNDNWDAIDSKLLDTLPIATGYYNATDDGYTYLVDVPTITSLKAGKSFILQPNYTATVKYLNVNSLGDKQIRRRISGANSLTIALDVNLTVSKPVLMTYDGTYWIASDIPKPNASDLYGTVPVANGGTGATTASAACSNIGALPLSGGTMTGSITIPNNKAVYYKNTSGTSLNILDYDAANWFNIGKGTYDEESGEGTRVYGNKLYHRSKNNIYWYPGCKNNSKDRYVGLEYDSTNDLCFFYPNVTKKLKFGMSTLLCQGYFDYIYWNSSSQLSDKRKKDNINYDLTELLDVFSELKPATFIRKDDENERVRIGFIAQDLEEAFAKKGIKPNDYDFLRLEDIDGEDPDIEDGKQYVLDYNEFIALNTAMIQKQQNDIDELKKEIEELKVLIKEK